MPTTKKPVRQSVTLAGHVARRVRFGTSSAFQSARRLGHSVVIAERHYAGLLPDISHDTRTLEDAMNIADLAKQIAEDNRIPQLAAG